MKDIWVNGKKNVDGWRNPDDYHVTTLFVGKDEDVMQESDIYKTF